MFSYNVKNENLYYTSHIIYLFVGLFLKIHVIHKYRSPSGIDDYAKHSQL